MTQKRVAIFLPDGVGIRNYLFSDLMQRLKESDAKILIYHKIGDAALNEVRKLHNLEFEAFELPNFKESVFEKFYRELDCLVRLKFFTKKINNETLITNWRPPKRTIMLRFFYFLIEFFSGFFKSYPSVLKITKLYEHQVAKSVFLKPFNELLLSTKPDVILCTHQRSILASPLFMVASKLNIKTITAIYSWDNLPKARMPLRASKYFVWSDYMKAEMALYYPEISQTDVIVTGTPQFEFYRKNELVVSRQEFCEKYGFDVNRTIICYSGGDTLTSPYDQVYLEDLAEAIQMVPEYRRPQILFRRCPVDWSDRYDEVLARFPDDVKAIDPLWTFEKDEIENWTLTFPRFEDVVLLVNVAYHCNLVYNVGSTMAHDYSMFDKPACYVNYNPAGTNKKYYSVEEIYQYQHFRSMPSPDSVVWINSKDEIENKVLDSIQNPQKTGRYRKEWVEKVILHPVEQASENICRELMG